MRKACREVFHNKPQSIPYLKAKYLGGVLTLGIASLLLNLQSNSYTEACNADDQELLHEACKATK